MAPRRPDRQAQPTGSTQEVTGPTSALTSFLREQGITGNINQRPATPSTTAPPTTGTPLASTSAGPSPPGSPSTPADDSDSSAPVPAPVASGSETKRKSTAAEVKAAALKKKKENEKSDAFKIPKGVNVGRALIPGSFGTCAECGKKFTISKYTIRNPRGAGVICTPCSNENIEVTAAGGIPKKAPAPKKKAVKRVDEVANRPPVPSLQACCIGVIGKNIENIEALGDIGPSNLDRISKIVCKHRALNGANLGLFLDISHRELSLYDCTNLTELELASIATFSPHLQQINLRMCGRLDGSVLEVWGERLRELKYLSLYAPYLVTPAQWKAYFGTFKDDRQLEGFGLIQSARFDDSCIELLVSSSPDLYNLQLSELGRLNEHSLSFLHPLKNLTTLDISRAGVVQGMVLTDQSVIALLAEVGRGLVQLTLDQNYLLTADVLNLGIHPHCPSLLSLSLSSLALLSSEPTAQFFATWSTNPGLTHLNLHRCILLENDALGAVILHSGKTLVDLNLHSVDEIDKAGLSMLAREAKAIEKLDVSFVRDVDDFVIKEILDGMEALKTLFVHGDNRVTSKCPQKRGVSIRGQENCMLVEL